MVIDTYHCDISYYLIFPAVSLWSIENQMHGRISTNTATGDYVGYSCQNQWSDLNAEYVCQSKGYRGGKALGSLSLSDDSHQNSSEIIWFGPLVCISEFDGDETCSFNLSPNKDCFIKNNAAGVLCYQDEGMSFLILNNLRGKKRMNPLLISMKLRLKTKNVYHFSHPMFW